MSRNHLVSVTTLLAALLTSSVAFAHNENSPFPAGVAVEAHVGGELFGNQWIIWKRRDNGACTAKQIGNFFGLTDDINVVGSSAGDLMIVQGVIETQCGKTLGTPLVNGHSLNLSGADGGDVMFGANPTGTVSGGNGDDIVTGDGPNVHLYGDLGNDDVEAWGTGAIETLLGDGLVGSPSDGNDCLWDKSKTADSVVCGGGFDQVNSIRATGHTDVCEQTVTCCNWAHFVGAC